MISSQDVVNAISQPGRSDDFLRNSGLIVRLPNGEKITNFDSLAPNLSRHILVAGLGRSGTTATARIFNALGFDFIGEPELMESKEMRKLLLDGKFELLNTKISTWNNLNRCGWKEPKLSSHKTKEFIYQLPDSIVLIIVFRDLVSSACRRSLEDGGDYLENLELVHRTYGKLLETVSFQTNRVCIFISYEKILVETEAVIRNLAILFGISDEKRIQCAIGSISVSPEDYLLISFEKRSKAFIE